jgi:hypothetical protein
MERPENDTKVEICNRIRMKGANTTDRLVDLVMLQERVSNRTIQ